MSNRTNNAIKALRWTCVVQLVMALIYIGAVIHSTNWKYLLCSILKVVATFPTISLALYGINELARKDGRTVNRTVYFKYAVVCFFVAIGEGFVTKLYIHGIEQSMLGALAALQISATILSVLIWQFKNGREEEYNLNEFNYNHLETNSMYQFSPHPIFIVPAQPSNYAINTV